MTGSALATGRGRAYSSRMSPTTSVRSRLGLRRPPVQALLLLLALLGGPAVADVVDPTEIIRRSDALLRGLESYARITMTIVRPEWNRTLVMEAWSQGASNAFIHTLSPAKERGVTFLKRGREAWQYVPAIDRTIKIPPSMMLQSWMGSDFTNDDVVRADSVVVDYTHALLEETGEGERAAWVIEGTPKPDAAVVWGKIVFRILKETFIAERIDYFDEDGTLVKYGESSDPATVEGIRLATRFVMHDVTRPGYRTDLKYDHLTFRPEIGPDTFSLRNLKR